MSSAERAGPNLFLVGAPKCGTTSLYEYLRRHPQIFFPADEANYALAKEPQHFCSDMNLSDRYAIHDRAAYLSLYRGAENAKWRGDASTFYLCSKVAPQAIRDFCPQARILIMLRPPLQMLRSYHAELLRWGQEDVADLDEALSLIGERMEGRHLPHDPGVGKGLDYIDVCTLAPQVARYFQTFGREAVKVILLEDMIASPRETYLDVLRFLDVPQFLPEFRVYNEAPTRSRLERWLLSLYMLPFVKPLASSLVPYEARRRVALQARRITQAFRKPDQTEEPLRELFRQDVIDLAALLGRDLRHWSQ